MIDARKRFQEGDGFDDREPPGRELED